MDSDTVHWYEKYATPYIARTDSFDQFRGLEDDLLVFTRRLRSGATVVDLGSGGGRDSRLIALNGYRVIALDACRSLLRRCVESAGPDHTIRGVTADLVALPFAGSSIGGIWACGSLLHLRREDIPAVVAQCFDALLPGAPIGLSMKQGEGSERRDDGRFFTYVSRREMADWLWTVGFERVSITGPSRNDWLLAIAEKPGSD